MLRVRFFGLKTAVKTRVRRLPGDQRTRADERLAVFKTTRKEEF